MSIPRNHHFVSQIHIKNFFNNSLGKIFVYDKILNNFYFKKTSKSLFSEKDLNTMIVDETNDFESLEMDLNIFFENSFSKNHTIIQNFIKDFNFSKEVEQALFDFAHYGSIGEIRNPRNKQVLEDTLYDTFYNVLYENCTPELKIEIDKIFSYQKETKYINATQYSELSAKIIESMGDLIFRIEIPLNENDYFLLPDFCSATVREKINTYFNTDLNEIAYIGFPISSKIYIHFYSTKIKNLTIKSGIVNIDSKKVFSQNKLNFDYSESKVACEDEKYLTEFIKTLHNTS
ncbi:MAG: DUF4238 domain-containing protein [Lutibacter sp.]|nr:DUF4238 domain-containing protein [Lutibacter sp.]